MGTDFMPGVSSVGPSQGALLVSHRTRCEAAGERQGQQLRWRPWPQATCIQDQKFESYCSRSALETSTWASCAPRFPWARGERDWRTSQLRPSYLMSPTLGGLLAGEMSSAPLWAHVGSLLLCFVISMLLMSQSLSLCLKYQS